MLQASFLQFPGIGPAREAELWQRGILDLRELRHRRRDLPTWTPPPEEVSIALQALSGRDDQWWAARLPSREAWRIAAQWPESILYLDIETTGLSRFYHEITMIGWSIGKRYGYWLSFQDISNLTKVLDQATALVTFNGSLFDLPFLQRMYASLRLPMAHIDLRYLARRVGLTGPQTSIETEVGYSRESLVAGLDGSHAPSLWRSYLRGDRDALRSLLEYNRADLEGMRRITDEVFRRLLAMRPLPARLSASPKLIATMPARPLPKRLPQHPIGARPIVDLEALKSSTERSLDAHIVGIDLSSTRPSGMSSLTGQRVEMARCLTDDEIISWTLDRKPQLVSIDAPLGTPTDGSIMRNCERELKRRGINVYPCLLPSMRPLTHRGMRLALRLRDHGVDVIESFPGAMQDILQFGRKQHGLTQLATALSEYGITGDLSHASHDELDALSSAIVGQFYLAGAAELLGDVNEGLLVVPSTYFLHHERMPYRPASVLALSGPSGSGKTSAAEHLSQEFGWRVLRTSRLLQRYVNAAKDQMPSRDYIVRLGQTLHNNWGQSWLWNLLSSNLIDSRSGSLPVVVDGIRFLEDVSFLRRAFGDSLCHVHITSPSKQRARRLLRRGDGSPEVSPAVVGGDSAELARAADTVVHNVGDLHQLLLSVQRAAVSELHESVRAG